MNKDNDFINWFPEETQDNVKKIWAALPESKKTVWPI